MENGMDRSTRGAREGHSKSKEGMVGVAYKTFIGVPEEYALYLQ
jgi:hypothetical protein